MKIVILSSQAGTLVNFRKDMILEIVKRGHEVVAVAAEEEYRREIESWGIRYETIKQNRTSINPVHDMGLLWRYYQFYKKEKPDLTFNYLIKPVIYGSIAAKAAKIKYIYSMITGLGSVFTKNDERPTILQILVKFMYRKALSYPEKVFFQNKDNERFFITGHLIRKDQAVVVNGSGVNMNHFSPSPLPSEPVFLLIARLIWDKGIREYIEAAKYVKEKYPNARFQLLGPLDVNPTAIKPAELQRIIDDNSIEYLGEKKDVRPFLLGCSAYVLPSYHEGTPHSVLEAMAVGRPIITTTAPGCRETVVDGVNGFLIPIKNSAALAEKMIWMIDHPSELEKMARKSLEICKEKFDVEKVNEKILQTMSL